MSKRSSEPPRGTDLSALSRWKGERTDRAEARQADEPLTIQKLRAEIAKLKADAEGKQLANGTTKGELVARADVERWAAAVITTFREAKLAVPDAVANILPHDIREHVRSELDRLEREALRLARIKLDELAEVPDAEREAAA